MAMGNSFRVVLKSLIIGGLAVNANLSNSFVCGQSNVAQPSRMATFDHAGETLFAASLTPAVTAGEQRASDVMIFVDTSASQVGAFKQDSIALVEQLLRTLNSDDRVKIFAVDLDPIPLTDGFVDPASQEAQVSIRSLQQRTPLGATDFELMLETAAGEFPSVNDRNRNVIYIGDGVPLIGGHESVFKKQVGSLADQRIAVSSYAVGAGQNVDYLAALANYTGGNLFIDNGEIEDAVGQAAIYLSNTVHQSVFWPTSAKTADNVVEIYPANGLPLRFDRDTILVGTLADRDTLALTFEGELNGKAKSLEWKLTPEASDIEFAFLSHLIKTARSNKGATLPTLSSAGLIAYREMVMANAEELGVLGSQALAMGDSSSAALLANASLEKNPTDSRADLLAMAVTYRSQDQDPFGDNPPGNDPFGNEPPVGNPLGDLPGAQDNLPATGDGQDGLGLPGLDNAGNTDRRGNQGLSGLDPPVELAPPTQDDPGRLVLIAPDQDDVTERLLRESRQQSMEQILSEEQRLQIVNERARKQVEFDLKRAREELRVNPDAAIDRLKLVMEIIDQTPDLFPATRQDLRFSLESALLSSRQRKLEFDEARARAVEIEAISRSRELRSVQLQRSEQEIAELLNRFNSLILEKNYAAARQVTQVALEKQPDNPHVVAANETARAVSNFERISAIRRQKEEKFFESLYYAEEATIPFPGDPWMVFPDPDEWREKVLRRRKFQDVRMAGSPIDESILKALEEPSDLSYDDEEWSVIQRDLFDRFGINIVIDPTAQDELRDDDIFSLSLSGIRLKFALRELLKQKGCTFVVKDEVLRIIRIEDVENPEFLVTNVYNVGDLVAPRMNMGGGMMGGMMGGMGGMGGGMMGGMGGMGGGMGGGMMGGMGGMGGGMFCLQESRLLNLDEAATSSTRRNARKPSHLQADSLLPVESRWRDYFSKHPAVDPAAIRETIRQLMDQSNPTEVVYLLNGAIENGQFQHWMFEAMVLAMRIADFPQQEIERAILSTLDVSSNPEDTLYAAQYMAANGMEQRALRVLKAFSKIYPVRSEPYLIGLKAAQKINDREGLKWASVGILSQEWPESSDVARQAKYVADGILLSLQKAGLEEEFAMFEDQLLEASIRDCYIRVEWTGDADIDIYVVEPNGSICSRLERRTDGGGVYLGDNYSPRANHSGIMREEYVLPKGFAGDYQLVIKRVWGEVTSNKVSVSIHHHYRSPNEASLSRQVNLDEKGAIVLFNLAEGRRKESLQVAAIQTAVKQQMTRNSLGLVFAGRVSNPTETAYGDYDGYQSEFVSSGNVNRRPSNRGRGLMGSGIARNEVGYQPIIEQIFEGGGVSVNYAATADRLYVMVSPTPIFTQISEISTFNILGNAETAQGLGGGGQGGGGLGGGGGGFGGGGGGGGFGGGGGGGFF